MNKREFRKQTYICPQIVVVHLQQTCSLLAGSPKGDPDNQGGTIVVPPNEDDDDTDISGAKSWGNLWEEE